MLIRLLDKRSETQRVPARPSRNEAGTTDRKIAGQKNGMPVYLYYQDRGLDDTEEPLSPALSPSEGAREKAPQLWV